MFLFVMKVIKEERFIINWKRYIVIIMKNSLEEKNMSENELTWEIIRGRIEVHNLQ